MRCAYILGDLGDTSLDDLISSLSIDGSTVEALIFFLISLPCVTFFATGNRVLTNFGELRARRAVEDGQTNLEPFVKNVDRYYMMLSVMEMLCVIAMFGFGHGCLSHWFEPWAVWLILASAYLVCDILFVRFSERADEKRLAGRYVQFLRPLHVLLTPLTAVLCWLVKPFKKKEENQFADAERMEEELELMVDESTKQGGLEDIQGRIMRSAIDFGDTTVREVMIPRTDITMIHAEAKLDDAFRRCVQEGYSRLPVYEDDIDSIVGVLYYKDLMKRVFELENEPEKRANETIRELVREVSYVPETKHIQAIFSDFQREHYHIAVVIDEFGGTAGIVTLEDILEEFFGEIQDEYDSEESTIVPVDDSGDTVKVEARTNISEIAALFDVEVEENVDFDTVGGLVSYKLGRVGSVGDEIVVSGLKFRVTDANEKCILKVEIARDTSAEAEETRRDTSLLNLTT